MMFSSSLGYDDEEQADYSGSEAERTTISVGHSNGSAPPPQPLPPSVPSATPQPTQPTQPAQQHHALVFHNIQCTINGCTILHDVHGTASTTSRGVFGILGPSGAGKTTLLVSGCSIRGCPMVVRFAVVLFGTRYRQTNRFHCSLVSNIC